MTPQEFESSHQALVTEISKVLVGQEDLVEHALVALYAEGHVLIEGVPGLGKTLLATLMARVLGCSNRRIQFTPDLMPSDITGGNVFNEQTRAFEFFPGPIFAQLVVTDEINRAPAKTQAALLEAMQEGSVTADGTRHELPSPFFVLATQNPVESQGTYPLPEAQLDRFLMKLEVDYPGYEVERQILRNRLAGIDGVVLESSDVTQVLSVERLLGMQEASRGANVSEELLAYLVQIVERTRGHRSIYLGASPRASLALMTSAQAAAMTKGRDFVVPDDVKQLAAPVLRHRLILHPDAEFEGTTVESVIDEILREIPVPRSAA